MVTVRLLVAGGAAAAGVAVWLNQPAGVFALALALAFAAFERWQVRQDGVSAAIRAYGEQYEDAARAVAALTDRLAALESECAKKGWAESLKR